MMAQSPATAPAAQDFVPKDLNAPPAPTAEPTGVPGETSLPPMKFTSSKAADEMDIALKFLAENPEIAARVRAAMLARDAKQYTREEAHTAEYWRKVAKDLAPKAPEGFDEDEAVYMVDLARVVIQMAKFRHNLPRVRPYYAVKCNNSNEMLEMLGAMGAAFDCASKKEIEQVLHGNHGTPEDIIFANPCKMPSNLRAAKEMGVRATTFDNEDELAKIAELLPSARAVLRIKTDDSGAVCQLSSKFGCPVPEATGLLDRAKELGVDVVGISFHVGSGNSDCGAYVQALRDCRVLFDEGIARGFDMQLLDIGGGFPGSDPTDGSMTFEGICDVVRPLLDELFSDDCVEIIAEPGRFFAESTYAIAMPIHSKRQVVTADGTLMSQLYTSDGAYGSFNCLIYDHQHPEIHVLHPDAESAMRTTTIFGPTCDSLDVILKAKPFPQLDIGEWIFCPNFGAYTVAAGSAFNGYKTRRFEFVSSLPGVL